MKRCLILTSILLATSLLCLVIWPVPDANATSCATPVVVKKVVATPIYTPSYATVVTPVVTYQPVVLAIPIYGASYVPAPVAPATLATPPAATTTAAGPSADTRAILDALRALDGRLRSLEGRGVPNAAPPPPGSPIQPAPPPGAAATPAGGTPRVFTNKCIQCHQRNKLAKGTDFVLLEVDGRVANLDLRQQNNMRKRLYNGSMPPKNNDLGVPVCTDQEVAEGMDYLDNLK